MPNVFDGSRRPLALLLISLALTACSPEGSSPSGTGGPEGGSEARSEEEAEGTRTALGDVRVGETLLEVIQIEFPVAGGEFEVFARPKEGPAPAATRIWLGPENAEGSRKGLVHEENDGPHAHVDVREDFDPEVHRIWIEVESEDGTRSRGSVPVRVAPRS